MSLQGMGGGVKMTDLTQIPGIGKKAQKEILEEKSNDA